MARTIAITGGIGAGKSTVCGLLRARGYPVVDADQLAREALHLPEVAAGVRGLFSQEVFLSEGVLDRELVRRLVFADPPVRQALEAITHPAIGGLFQAKKRQLQSVCASAWLFYEASLIFESGRAADFDAVVLVRADPALRAQRLLSARGMPAEEAARIMGAQLPDDAKAAASHFVLENAADTPHLESRLDALLEFLRARFSPPNP